MGRIIASAMRLRTLVIALAVVLAGFGGWQLREVPLDVIPEFSPVSIEVKTEALGLSAAEVEALITVPLEADLLNGVPYLARIQSESAAGVSSIQLHFSPQTDLLRARQMVQERLTQTHALPQVSTPPVMLQPVSTASRIMNIGLSSPTVSLIELTVQAHWNIVPRLVGVPGVANVSIWGRRQRQVQIEVDPVRLHRRGVTLEQIVKTAGEAVFASPLTFLNSSTPGTGGFIDTPNQRLNIRHVSPIASPEQFARVPVYEATMPLGDVTRVVESHQPLIGDAIIGDGPGILLVVEKFPGFNTQQVTRAVEAAMAELRPGLPGVDIDTGTYRPAGFLERATTNLAKTAAFALALGTLALFLVLGNWRRALIAAFVIPLSLLAGAIVLVLAGSNFDMLLLAGLMLAIGVVVQDGILDADVMARRLQAARARADRFAAGSVLLEAMGEARGAMLFASVIALLAAAPVLFLEGLSAAFFRPLVFAYVAAILASFAVALVVTPALGVVLLRGADARELGTGGLAAYLLPAWQRASRPMTRSILPAGALAILSLAILGLTWTRMERNLVPSFGETDVVVEWQAPDGTSLQAMSQVTMALMRELRALPGVRNAAAQIGRAVMCNCEEVSDVNTAQVWVSIDPAAPYQATLAAIRESLTGYPGMTGQVGSYLSRKMREALTGDEERITVRVYGHDIAILRQKAEEIRRLIADIPGIRDTQVERQVEQATIEVEVDLARAALHGLKPGDIRRATSTLVSGITVGALFEQQKVFDVVVWGPASLRENIGNLRNLMLDTDLTRQVRLADVADVRTVPAPAIIRRQGVSRRLDVEADVSSRSLTAVAREVGARVQSVVFPFEYHAQVLGESAERRAALRSVDSYLLAAVVLGFLVLQAALRSWRLALASALGVPIVALGGTLAVLLGSGIVTLGAILGCVAVLLLTLRCGIIQVREIQMAELRDGAATDAAIEQGTQAQFAATLATLMTTAAIALPFAVTGSAAGLEILNPMAVAMLGALIGSAFVLFVLLPALCRRLGAGSARDPLGLEPQAA